MTRGVGAGLKFGVFVIVMLVLMAGLFAVFAEYRGGPSQRYTAIFANVSDLKSGDSVRVSGVRVGTVAKLTLQPDKTVEVVFDADDSIALTTGTRAAVRYLNLVGDRYLELSQEPGSTRLLSAGEPIPPERTSPALDLDVLLNGLRPVVQGLDPRDVNALTTSLIEIVNGNDGTVASLTGRTASFTRALADNGEVIEALIVQLNEAIETISKHGARFGTTIDLLHQLVAELSAERDPIGAAIDALSSGTASVVGLLTESRPPLADTVDQLDRLAPALEAGKDQLDGALNRAPENYRKLARIGSYGSFFNYYLCGVTWRVSDLQGRTAAFPWIKQETGRCADQP